jgi:hypothetical protein
MYNVIQNLGQRNGEKAMNSLLERANLQSASNVETRLFTPHVSKGSERIKANHENYRR